MINKNEKGFALVLSLVLLMVMSLMGGALIVISSGDHQSNNTSDQYQQAFYVAETGLLEAEKAIINQYNFDYTVHGELSVNLMDEKFFNDHKEVLKKNIEVSGEIGATHLITHFGYCSITNFESPYTFTSLISYLIHTLSPTNKA